MNDHTGSQFVGWIWRAGPEGAGRWSPVVSRRNRAACVVELTIAADGLKLPEWCCAVTAGVNPPRCPPHDPLLRSGLR
jgi:hypothetical protein